MKDIANKSDNTAGATGELPAAEYNDHKEEIQEAVESSTQILNVAIVDQFAKALFINGAGASSVQDSSSGDSIILSPVTGASGLKVPDLYANFDSGVLMFNKTTPNTSTSVTVNFGQTGTELGAKTLVRPDGTVPQIGDVNGLMLIKWDNGNDRWEIISNGNGIYNETISVTGTFTPQFGMNHALTLDTLIGGFTLTLADGKFDGQFIDLWCIDTGTGNAFYKGTNVYDGGAATGTPLSPNKYIRVTWRAVIGWVYEDVVTADYFVVLTNYRIFSNGELETNTIDNTTVTATQTITLSVPYDSTTYQISIQPDALSPGVNWVSDKQNASVFIARFSAVGQQFYAGTYGGKF